MIAMNNLKISWQNLSAKTGETTISVTYPKTWSISVQSFYSPLLHVHMYLLFKIIFHTTLSVYLTIKGLWIMKVSPPFFYFLEFITTKSRLITPHKTHFLFYIPFIVESYKLCVNKTSLYFMILLIYSNVSIL